MNILSVTCGTKSRNLTFAQLRVLKEKEKKKVKKIFKETMLPNF